MHAEMHAEMFTYIHVFTVCMCYILLFHDLKLGARVLTTPN